MAARVTGEAIMADPSVVCSSPMQSEVANGLLQLETRRPPNLAKPENWAGVLADAKRLANDGWAEQALALGWSMLDLFGVGPKDSWEFAGLAVWLNGRDVLMLDAERAIAGCGDDRATFIRGGWGHGKDDGLPLPVLLWNFGRRT